MIVLVAPFSRLSSDGKMLWNHSFFSLFGERVLGLLKGMDNLHFLVK